MFAEQTSDIAGHMQVEFKNVFFDAHCTIRKKCLAVINYINGKYEDYYALEEHFLSEKKVKKLSWTLLKIYQVVSLKEKKSVLKR